MDIFFPYGTPAHIVSSAGFVISTWLGAYLAAHVPRSSYSRLVILSLFALSAYYLHTILCLFMPAQQAGYLWRRFMGWFALIPFPFWLHLTSKLLPEEQRNAQRTVVRMTYAVALWLGAVWVIGGWQFSRITLLPPRLVWPILLFVTGVSGVALCNVWALRKQAADQALRARYTLLAVIISLLMAGILYWPLVNWLELPWNPITRLAVGDSFPLASTLTLAYSVAFHKAFVAGRWGKRDFFFHAVVVIIIASLYLLTMLGAWRFAIILGFDTPLLALIAVVGLAILTHLLALPARRWWESQFFEQLRPIRRGMRVLIQMANDFEGRLESQMNMLVRRLTELTGASTTCVALLEDGQLIVKASTNPEYIGKAIPADKFSARHPSLAFSFRSQPDEGHHSAPWNCFHLAEAIRVNGEVAGYLLLGERGMGEGYDRDERVWIFTLAAHLGAALEHARQREEITRMIAELESEAREVARQTQVLDAEFAAALSGPPPRVSRQELREAIYAYNDPARMEEIVAREGSTLATLPAVCNSNLPAAQALQQQLTLALNALVPYDLPSLRSLRERSRRNKRRAHLPVAVADYYTLRLVMSGCTHEDVAEKLGVSPRQVRNYLTRAIGTMKTFLEREAQSAVNTPTHPPETPRTPAQISPPG